MSVWLLEGVNGIRNSVRTLVLLQLSIRNPEEISCIQAGAEYVAKSSSVTRIISDCIARKSNDNNNNIPNPVGARYGGAKM
nr:hypothetical protein [Tanacetum cinerariifolium]